MLYYIRIDEGIHELEQSIIIATIEHEIVRTGQTKAKFFHNTHTRYGNFDGDGFVAYLNRIYGQGSAWILQFDNQFTIRT
jgi:hypothetical protein